jgi:anti-sigma-K factor RskA
MTCEELRDSFEFYALGVLEEEERTEIDAHLARGCERCSKALANALAINASVLSFAPAIKSPKRLKRRLLAAIGVHYPGWGWVWALGTVAAVVIAVFLGFQERQRSAELTGARRNLMQVTQERDRLTRALEFLSDPRTQPASFGLANINRAQSASPRGYVFLNPQMGVLLIASNLPAAGDDKTYEMWVIPKNGATPRPAGLFQSADTRALHILNGPIDPSMLITVTVTIEPAAGSPAPTTKPVIVAALAG